MSSTNETAPATFKDYLFAYAVLLITLPIITFLIAMVVSTWQIFQVNMVLPLMSLLVDLIVTWASFIFTLHKPVNIMLSRKWYVRGITILIIIGSGICTGQMVRPVQHALNLQEHNVASSAELADIVKTSDGCFAKFDKRLNNYPDSAIASTKDAEALLGKLSPQIFVFYKVGCEHCEAAHSTIAKQVTAKNKNNVHYVNVASDAGKLLAKKFSVALPTTLVSYDAETQEATRVSMFKLDKNGGNTNNLDKGAITALFKSVFKHIAK